MGDLDLLKGRSGEYPLRVSKVITIRIATKYVQEGNL